MGATRSPGRCGRAADASAVGSRVQTGEESARFRTLDEAAKSACFAELTPYGIQAGDGFVATGRYSGTPLTGYLHRLVPSPVAAANGRFECVDQLTLTTDPAEQARLALRQGRVPLLPPVCANNPPQDWPPSPNPCRVEGASEQYYFDGGEGAPLTDGRAVKAYFANPVINVEFLIGQLDQAGGLVVNPPPSQSYSIQADVGGWFQPLVTTLSSYIPETLLAGPDGYIYVIDAGLNSSAPQVLQHSDTTTARPVFFTDAVKAIVSSGLRVRRSTTSHEIPSFSSSAAAISATSVILE